MFTKKLERIKNFLKNLPHGIISGSADNDPAGIATYSVVGATTGFALLWLIPLSTVFLIAVQSICAKIGDVTQKGLAEVVEKKFGRAITVIAVALLIVSNLATLGADLAGIGAALNLLFPKSNQVILLSLVTLVIWALMVKENFPFLNKILLGLTLALLSYVFSAFLAQPDWLLVLKSTLIPQISPLPSYWLMAVGFLGTTITPFLFFWQTIEEMEDHPLKSQAKKEVQFVAPGMIWSNLITFFIIVATGAVLYDKGISLKSAADAALALLPFLGSYAFVIFALGIIGSGLLAVPILVSSVAYSIAETFNWKEGLSQPAQKAKSFYLVLTLAFLIGLIISLIGINPIVILFYTQVLNGFISPILLFLILLIANDGKIMGNYKNGFWSNFALGLTILLMVVSVLGIWLT